MRSSSNHNAILSVLYWAAISDGDLDNKEIDILKKAAGLFGNAPTEQANQSASNSMGSGLITDPTEEQLSELLSSVASADDRQLLVKLAFQLVACSRRSIDTEQININEKAAYRRIVSASNLSQEMINEAEWSAKVELAAKKPPSDLIKDLIDKVKSVF